MVKLIVGVLFLDWALMATLAPRKVEKSGFISSVGDARIKA